MKVSTKFKIITIEGIPDSRYPIIGNDIEVEETSLEPLYKFIGELIAQKDINNIDGLSSKDMQNNN